MYDRTQMLGMGFYPIFKCKKVQSLTIYRQITTKLYGKL